VWTNRTVDSPQNWTFNANWSAPTAFPNAVGAVAFITNNPPGDQTIQINATITNGSLTIGNSDLAHFFTLAGNGGAFVLTAPPGKRSGRVLRWARGGRRAFLPSVLSGSA
jgi:hypothetical protein